MSLDNVQIFGGNKFVALFFRLLRTKIVKDMSSVTITETEKY